MMTEISVLPTSYFTDYCRLFCGLQSLVDAGNDEGAEGETLRDDMDVLWRRLTSADLERLDGLAVDLSCIGVDRAYSGTVPKALNDELRQILAGKDFDAALRFVRDHEDQLPPDHVPVLRGIFWGDLGQHVPASMFFADAVRLRPKDVQMRALYFRSLLKSGQLALAKSEAVRMVADTADPFAFLLAADVLFDSLDWREGAVPEPELRQVIQLTIHGMKALGTIAPNSWRAAIASSALFSQALSHEILGETSEAMVSAAEAERLAPLRRANTVTGQAEQGPAEGNGRFRRHLQECRQLSHDAFAQLAGQPACAA
jgi:hypothetical protein